MNAVLDGKDLSNFKIIVIGSSQVGKTSIINKYINKIFIESYFPTKDFM